MRLQKEQGALPLSNAAELGQVAGPSGENTLPREAGRSRCPLGAVGRSAGASS